MLSLFGTTYEFPERGKDNRTFALVQMSWIRCVDGQSVSPEPKKSNLCNHPLMHRYLRRVLSKCYETVCGRGRLGEDTAINRLTVASPKRGKSRPRKNCREKGPSRQGPKKATPKAGERLVVESRGIVAKGNRCLLYVECLIAVGKAMTRA